jgi:hypothetical protein
MEQHGLEVNSHGGDVMGYCMDLRASKFNIPESLKAKALEAIKGIMGPENRHKMHGGSWTGGKQTGWWYSWVKDEDVLKCITLDSAMALWGWPVELDAAGNVDGIRFEGEKIGQEDEMFKAIAPYVEDGSYVEMGGEDGALWRWSWARGKFYERSAIITWDTSGED